MQTAALIWMTLLLALAATTAALGVPRRRPATPCETDPSLRHLRFGRERARRAAASAEDLRRSGEIRLAAERAAEKARQRRTAWEQAQHEVEAAWAAYDSADRVARRCTAAAAFPVLQQRRTRAEIADRERFLHRRAVAACRCRELSMGQLNEVLAHRGGWNPRRHPVAQETALRCAVREHRFAELQAATQRERAAWLESERAAVALRSLRAEAVAAATSAGRTARPVGPQRRAAAEPAARPAAARLAVH
ncbi:hypothetical protein [Actinoplanes sp. TFC3]|uniref:hypothetical protein n=1 Tax=Actinoplanes sp. TFC3 TaxID=1710355 RepID=UPI00082F68C8|nr:hypothetical protein [Actinoplanes sp. TFC3]